MSESTQRRLAAIVSADVVGPCWRFGEEPKAPLRMYSPVPARLAENGNMPAPKEDMT